MSSWLFSRCSDFSLGNSFCDLSIGGNPLVLILRSWVAASRQEELLMHQWFWVTLLPRPEGLQTYVRPAGLA